MAAYDVTSNICQAIAHGLGGADLSVVSAAAAAGRLAGFPVPDVAGWGLARYYMPAVIDTPFSTLVT